MTNHSAAPAANRSESTTMTKEEWIRRAADKLAQYESDNAAAYAESLYETYVEDDAGYENDPEGAVEEDMSYWGD